MKNHFEKLAGLDDPPASPNPYENAESCLRSVLGNLKYRYGEQPTSKQVVNYLKHEIDPRMYSRQVSQVEKEMLLDAKLKIRKLFEV